MTKIEIVTDGPWIIQMKEDGDILSKEEANILFDWILTSVNTTQYPEDEEEDKNDGVMDKIDKILKDWFKVKLNWADNKAVEYFKYWYIRNKEQVIENELEYYEIRCPIEYVDVESMICNDNDFIQLDDDTFLYIQSLECDIDDLIEDGYLLKVII